MVLSFITSGPNSYLGPKNRYEKSFEGNLSLLMSANIESLMAIHEIGDIMAESIHKYFNTQSNIEMIQICMQAGIAFEKVEKIHSSKYYGKIFVFTGSLQKFTRKDAQNMVEKLGARTSNSVSSNSNPVSFYGNPVTVTR